MATLKTAVIRYEETEISIGSGSTIGEMIDARISAALENHEILHDITLHFEPDELAPHFVPARVGKSAR